MNFNILLKRVELNLDCFKEKDIEPVKTNNEVNVNIKEYYHTIINISDNQNIHEKLRIKRLRFFCINRPKSFTNKIDGIQ